VKLLFDENLSRKLPHRLHDLYPGSIHVSEADLLQTPDATIWAYARENAFVIVTADSDFFEALLRRQAIRISDFEQDPDLGILVLDLS
jgi:predicted nuclease of predicted toxin-antitoxin system